MIYLELFLGFLKVGAFAFGGGYGAIPLIRETAVAYGWLDDERLSDMIAISESTPGPIAVNLATYVGSAQGGVLGALIATAATILPAFLIVIILMNLLKNVIKNEGVKSAIDGIKACVVGIILATGAYMAFNNIFFVSAETVFDWKALVITAALALIYFGSRKIRKQGISPILLIVIAGVTGVLVNL